jgi:hypothetical protein
VSSAENIPQWHYIIAITNDVRAQVETDSSHGFVDGQIVSFRVTKPFGMFEINNMQTQVTVISSTVFETEINTSFWNEFIYPASEDKVTPPTVVPVGSGVVQAFVPYVTLDDAFDRVRT